MLCEVSRVEPVVVLEVVGRCSVVTALPVTTFTVTVTTFRSSLFCFYLRRETKYTFRFLICAYQAMALFTASRALRVLSNSRVSNWTITKEKMEKIIQSFQRKEVRRDGPDMSEYDAKFINKGHDDHGYRPSDSFQKVFESI